MNARRRPKAPAKASTAKASTPKRSGAPWPGKPPELDELARAALVVVLALRAEGAPFSPGDVAARLGVRDVRPALEALDAAGLLHLDLTRPQRACLAAISKLERELGTSPTTRQVSAAMGLSPSGSRFHIASLARMGLVTPPRRVLILSVTPTGRAFLPPGG